MSLSAGCGGGGGSSGGGVAATTSTTTPGPPSAGNTAPSFASAPPTGASEGQAYAYLPSASDPEGDPLTFSLVAGPAGLSVDPASGAVGWTPQPGQAGDHDVILTVSDGVLTQEQRWTITVAPGSGSSGPGTPSLPTNAVLTDLGRPPGGLPVISDLVVFDDRLWLLETLDPLNQFGAQVWTYDDTGSFTQVLDDPTSQGYLRGKVSGGRLFIPDSDPNGLAPGIVHVFDDASSAPVATVVEGAVHNFDVVEFGGELYVSGGLDTGASSLSRYDPLTQRWTVASTGPFSRLKYMAVAGNSILASKRSTGASTADLVVIDASLQQQGATVIPGVEGLTIAVEAVGSGVYLSVASNQGVSHLRVDATGNGTPLTGISGAILFDYVQHTDGFIYAVGSDLSTSSTLYGSTDGLAFVPLAGVNDLRFGRVGQNADGRPSIASFQGQLFCGSSTNGRLYRVD